jgi:ribonucleoside-diphosphate reductase subunit M2
MSVTITAPAAPTLFDTSTKVANDVDGLCLGAKPLDLTQKLTEASKPEEAEVDNSRNRFVGDLDLDEKDEPLLKESKRRFVLFPIQYNEVRVIQAF